MSSIKNCTSRHSKLDNFQFYKQLDKNTRVYHRKQYVQIVEQYAEYRRIRDLLIKKEENKNNGSTLPNAAAMRRTMDLIAIHLGTWYRFE